MAYFMVRAAVVIMALSFLGISSPAEAQSQTGGLPDVSDRVSVLEGIATSLQTAVTTLQTMVTTLQNQVTTLQAADAALQNSLDAEIAARAAAEAALQEAVNQEGSNRAAGDSSLLSRIESDEALIDSTGQFYSVLELDKGLVMGASRTVATLGPLPVGNYLAVGRVLVRNTIHDADWLCTLRWVTSAAEDASGEDIDEEIGFTENDNLGSRSAYSTVNVAGIARVTIPGSLVMLRCQNLHVIGGSEIPSVRLLAVRIGQPG